MKKISKGFTLSKGFTFIELVVVLGIVGILSAVIVPSLSQFLPGVQLNGSVRTLSGDLRVAQEKTITEQKQYLIRFFPNSSPPYYQTIQIIDGSEKLIHQTQLNVQETLQVSTTISNNQIIFSPDGGPSSSGDITLSVNGVSKAVNVSPAGFIAIH